MSEFKLPASVIDGMSRHAEETFPAECCGALLRRGGQVELRRFRNVQDDDPMLDQNDATRSAETAYRVHPDDELQLQRDLSVPGVELVAIYHSHPNAGAYFSEMDRDVAMAGGAWDFPAYPDHVVVSVIEGKTADLRAFLWDDDAEDFIGYAITPE